jgi:hypothetical protein
VLQRAAALLRAVVLLLLAALHCPGRQHGSEAQGGDA